MQRFEIAEWLIGRTRWDLFMMVDMGVDRFQHAFLRLLDRDHPAWKSTPGPTPEDIERGREFLMKIDVLAGRLIDLAEDDTTVMVVSDHGARPLEGGFAINEWLIREGYLVLRQAPSPPARLEPRMVDWSKTRAWGEGGYVARVFVNMEGREPEGIVAQGKQAARLVTEIKDGLESLAGPDGWPMKNRAFRPADVYDEVRGLPPDLLVELKGLACRAVSTCGGGDIFVPGNDTGPDDANHDHDGVIVMAGPGIPAGGTLEGLSVKDVPFLAEDSLRERTSIPPGGWPD
jgi:predicted AlkP superfamily phosphohydrolase/phosphomutase